MQSEVALAPHAGAAAEESLKSLIGVALACCCWLQGEACFRLRPRSQYVCLRK